MWSVAEPFAYCTLKTVSIEDAGDTLQTFGNVCISVFIYFCLLFYVYCMHSPVQHIMIYYTYLTYNYIFYIFILLMHIKVFRSQDCVCPEDMQYSSLPTLSKDILSAMLPDVAVNYICLHEGDRCPCNLVTDVRVTQMQNVIFYYL